MKKIFTLLFVSVFALTSINAQEAPPQAFSYKATITKSNGAIIANKTIGLKISILDSYDSPVYIETHNPTTNEYGQIDIAIGQNPDPGYDFAYIDWSAGIYYLKTEVDAKGGTDYSLMSIAQLLSVPYALYAENVSNNDDADADPANELQDLSINDHELAITYGSTITLPDEVDDADPDPENELITGIDLKGTNLRITEASNTNTVNLGCITSNLTLAEILTNENDAGLIPIINLGDPVNDHDAVTKAYVDDLKSEINALEDMLIDAGLYKMVDLEGNSYSVVRIGDQVWMAENLAYLPSVSPPILSNTEPYYFVYGYWGNNVSEAKATSNYNTYGVLYNWPAALNACPDGWHLPTDAEWTELENYHANNGYNYDGSIGGGGGKIAKAMATDYGWNYSSNTGAIGNADYPEMRNASGFSALPGGNSGDRFYGKGNSIDLWSSEESSTIDHAWTRTLRSQYCDFYRTPSGNYMSMGMSVRCVKDNF